MQTLNLPQNQIIYLQLRLKGLYEGTDYKSATLQLIEWLDKQFKPKTILTPVFNYSFTKTGIYDRTSSPCQVGRFGEELRLILGPEHRTMNPIFSVMDTHGFLKGRHINENTAYGKGSLLDMLEPEGYISLNINLDDLKIFQYHVLEQQHNVDYRYIKIFEGKVSADGVQFEQVQFEYFVRNTELDTQWRREKMKQDLMQQGLLQIQQFKSCECNWIHSADLKSFISKKLQENIRYLITD